MGGEFLDGISGINRLKFRTEDCRGLKREGKEDYSLRF
jgi:hypothetical protein